MQICSKCHTTSADAAVVCPACGANLGEFSTTAVALKRLKTNPRVKNIRLVVANDACPACQELEGTYLKDEVPVLPVEGCSGGNGCQCFYEPMFEEIYP